VLIFLGSFWDLFELLKSFGFHGMLITAFGGCIDVLYNSSTDMGVPRHHMAKGKQLRRRSHLALKKQVLAACANCRKAVKPHTVCKACGFYKGREVVNVLAKQLKKTEKKKQQQK
jgi:large subunit ribosomal protein L32